MEQDQMKNEWIKVSKRLPVIDDSNYSEEVLVYRANDTFTLAVVHQDYYSKALSWVRSLDYWPLRDVVAWMPLPERCKN